MTLEPVAKLGAAFGAPMAKAMGSVIRLEHT
jgi:hypothetical protein